MYTIFISLLASGGVCFALGYTGISSWVWASILGVAAFIAIQVAVSKFFSRKIKAAIDTIQEIMKNGQRRMQALQNSWQHRPPGSVQQAEKEMQNEQKRTVGEAIRASEGLEKYDRWVPMMSRQLATMRLQLYWAVQDFEKVDELMPKALFFDPMMASIKLARMYMKDAKTEELEKFYRKAAARLRVNQGAVLHGAYSWMLVQRKDYDAAHKVLVRACEKSDNPVLKTNRDNLANNRIAHFNNSGLGEEWWSLQLEKPKIRTQRQQQRFGRPF